MAKKRKEISAQAKRRMLVFAPFCLFFMAYFAVSIVSYTYDVYRLQHEKSKLDLKYANLQEISEELKIEITKLHDPEYLARYAREQYLYSKEGELIIKIYETEKDEVELNEEKQMDQMIIILSVVAVFLIFLYILIRGNKKRNQSA